MKNIIVRYLRFVICSLFFILCIAACGGEEIETEKVETTPGRLTITGLDAFEGRDIFAGTSQYNYSSNARIYQQKLVAYKDSKPSRGKIYSGQVTLNVYANRGFYEKWLDYDGNDRNMKFYVCIVGTVYGTVTVNFTNGIASGIFVEDE